MGKVAEKITVGDAAEVLLRSKAELWTASVAVHKSTGKKIDADSVNELLLQLAKES